MFAQPKQLLGKKKVLLDKREQAMSSVRQLGTRPTDAEQWSGKSSKVLKKALKRCNEELKKFSHVNKKALDQYASFSEQRTNLLTRRNELNDGYGAIHELIKVRGEGWGEIGNVDSTSNRVPHVAIHVSAGLGSQEG